MKTTFKTFLHVKGYLFVSHVDQTARPEITLENLLNKVPNDDNLKRSGFYKLAGYRYDVRQYLKRFVYLQYGSWHEAYAVNRTGLRKQTYGKIDHILDFV